VADVVLGIKSGDGERRRVVDGLVDLEGGRVVGWEEGGEGVQPLVCFFLIFFFNDYCGFSWVSCIAVVVGDLSLSIWPLFDYFG
jgi:hypothetical protein